MKRSAGFTLIELLIVIALGIVITAVTIPIGINFYKNQILDESTDNILMVLRLAYNQSVFQKNDSAFGIKFLTDSYVLFQGNSYASRSLGEDEIFDLSNDISTSGINEIVFTKLTGTTTQSTLNISSGNNNKIISINEQGKTEIQ